MNTNTMNCLYNVHFAFGGFSRMTGRAVTKEYGWDSFNDDSVEHSEWCGCNRKNEREDGSLIDYMLDAFGDSPPPF